MKPTQSDNDTQATLDLQAQAQEIVDRLQSLKRTAIDPMRVDSIQLAVRKLAGEAEAEIERLHEQREVHANELEEHRAVIARDQVEIERLREKLDYAWHGHAFADADHRDNCVVCRG